MGHKIYGISADGDPKHIRYVGETVFCLDKRLKEHIKEAKRKKNNQWKNKTHNYTWIRFLLQQNKSPVMHLLDEKQEYDELLEQHWIKKFRDEGYDLVNHSDGGKCSMRGKHHTEEAKKKIGLARLNFKVSDETRKKISFGGNPFATRIKQYDKKGSFIKKWDCVKEAALFVSGNHGDISRCCKKNTKLKKTNFKGGSVYFTAHGYVWTYENQSL